MYSSDFKSLAIKLYHKIKSLRKVSIMIETSHSSISRWINYSIHHKSNKWQKSSLMDNIFYPRQLELYLKNA